LKRTNTLVQLDSNCQCDRQASIKVEQLTNTHHVVINIYKTVDGNMPLFQAQLLLQYFKEEKG
jgi:hypothetical protein